MRDSINFHSQLEKKEKKLKQKIVSLIVIFFMFLSLMSVTGKLNFVRAESNVVQLKQNIVAGQLDLTVMAEVGFNNATAGTAANSLANMSVFNVEDGTGTGAGWSVTGYSSNLVNGTDTATLIPNTRIYWQPSDGFFGLNGASNTNVTKYSSLVMLNTAQTIITAAATAGMGKYNVPNTTLNVVIQAGDLTADYNAVLTMTLS